LTPSPEHIEACIGNSVPHTSATTRLKKFITPRTIDQYPIFPHRVDKTITISGKINSVFCTFSKEKFIIVRDLKPSQRGFLVRPIKNVDPRIALAQNLLNEQEHRGESDQTNQPTSIFHGSRPVAKVDEIQSFGCP